MSDYTKIAQLKNVAAFRARLAELSLALPVDDKALTAAEGSPLAEPLQLGPWKLANRFCIHPMEGWDANRDGSPSPHTLRRWRNFGRSGASLIWGGEAAAVQPDGRANPLQTMAIDSNRAGLRALLDELYAGHEEVAAGEPRPVVGLQLTHSGRFSRPNDKRLEPRIAYHHPLLDAKFGIDPSDASVVWTDDDLERLIDAYVAGAKLAYEVGYQFVDVKACHGYLLHEFLSARSRPGKFGGDLEARSRLLRTIIGRIRSEIPHLQTLVRISIFDTLPYQTSRETGKPMPYEHLLPYDVGFGVDKDDPTQVDLAEPIELLKLLAREGVPSVNVSCGSPYYNPHIQRPAIFPPSDGYQPPEDPLVGVFRQIEMHSRCKQAVPELVFVGTGYSYLQDYLPHVAQAVVREGWIDMVGLGRMVLSYPELPRDVLHQASWARKKVCRTFSDCTTAPRNGIVSGCYPLDPYYKELPEAEQMRELKQELKA
ncbi:NADH:flavin oxidoreductase/NADH oxidase [Pirellula staleyi DSM 6068]|uniref:NADH:flavin oxidoreductase/NADH oxidase n=1 Tax=Pirellula staleyi (strain ATCC 27377 / DSM 6068 / ICPB 4128) TaxID=530564 RepID=D2R5I7_PIRSD|nr:NADH:flavin oxidoreductase [Pirellula staleyi]ADB15446.1 NADH:flavin oxidoreductase/NADH oxidase [Pirellula staleyi DSM 6068]